MPERAPRGLQHAALLPAEFGRARPEIKGVRPSVDGGTYPGKASLGELVDVQADVFADGHDDLVAELRFRSATEKRWQRGSLSPVGNDRFVGAFSVQTLGRYEFQIRAMVDSFATWRRAFAARAEAGQDLAVERLVGAALVRAAASRAKGADRRSLIAHASGLEEVALSAPIALDQELATLMLRYVDPATATLSSVYTVEVERERARFSSWYELFPRSASPDPLRAGTLRDVADRLEYVAELGFDVLYLPPIHPIGTTARKGPNGTSALADSSGSPWAIGSSHGGHTTVNPDLGTLADFDLLIELADVHGIEVALDLALQCSPDHPWVHEHPSWFRTLPDGSIRSAENPPKLYEDVYPLDFECEDWRALWQACFEIVEFWIDHGVRIFRVDNPHTKPLRFWEWLIASIRHDHPDVVMLAEAFTRPRIMEHLAKIGFSQSYTYFTWRNSPAELQTYLDELVHTPVADYLRPNLWPNTPDILHETLQRGGRPTFIARLVLAATLSSNYGIYGPAYELVVNTAREQGSEEYLDSEKYEVRHWKLDDPTSLHPFIHTINAARRTHPCLQQNRTLRFHPVNNDRLLAYSKTHRPADGSDGPTDAVLVVVNTDPTAVQAGTVYLDLAALGIGLSEAFVVHDLLSDMRYTWTGSANYVRLDPLLIPAHLFVLERSVLSPQ